MYGPVPNVETDILGDEWVARLRRQHERHAGIPDYGHCPDDPGRHRRPWPVVITSADLAQQRRQLAHDSCDECGRLVADFDRGWAADGSLLCDDCLRKEA